MDSGQEKRERMAGFILMKCKDKDLISYAVSLLDHPDEAVRRYAVGALKNITGLDFESEAQWKAWRQKNP